MFKLATTRQAHLRGALSRAKFCVAASGAAAAFAIKPVCAKAAQYDWKLAFADAADSPTAINWVRMANAVRTETGGTLDIKVFPDNQLGSQASQLQQVRLGSLQMINLTHGVFASLSPVTQISGLPFVFNSYDQAFDLMDGELGAYIRKDMSTKGMYVFKEAVQTGFRIITSFPKPIRNADDLVGFKIRVLPAAVDVECFKALGAAPAPIDAADLYAAMQSHLVDGHENSLIGAELYKSYEVQKYLSLTNHMWSGSWLVANPDAWTALPANIQAIVTRNVTRFALQERKDSATLNNSLTDKLRSQGLTVNTPDVASMRARLGPFYARWKTELGPTAWTLLEAKVGKLA